MDVTKEPNIGENGHVNIKTDQGGYNENRNVGP